MADGDKWVCPNCKVLCAIERASTPENVITCMCNHSNGTCYYCQGVIETEKRLREAEEDARPKKIRRNTYGIHD